MPSLSSLNMKKLEIDNIVKKRVIKLSHFAIFIRILTTLNVLLPVLGIVLSTNVISSSSDHTQSTTIFTFVTVLVGILAYFNSIFAHRKEILTRYRTVQQRLSRYKITGCNETEYQDLIDVIADIEITDAIYTEPIKSDNLHGNSIEKKSTPTDSKQFFVDFFKALSDHLQLKVDKDTNKLSLGISAISSPSSIALLNSIVTK